MRRLLGIVVVTFVLSSVVALSPAASQPPPTQSPSPAPQASQKWQVQCTSPTREAPAECVLAQGVALGGRASIRFNIRVPGDTRKPLMVVQTPLGSLLPAGITLDVDGAGSLRLEYRNCDTNGCYANSPVSDDLLQAMFQGRTLNVTIQALNGQPAKVSMDLNGFTAAYRSVR